MNYEVAIKNIRNELKDYIVSHNIKSLVMGISGGIDSCLCAALAKPVCDELGIMLIGRSLPISTNAQDEIDRAKLTGKVFCHNFEEVSLLRYFNELTYINPDYSNSNLQTLDNEGELKNYLIRNGNIKARLRMIYLYNLASCHKGMVLSTDNYTELMLGFWTLHGDVGDYGMIQNLWKSEVYDMAEWIVDNELKFIDEQTAISSTIDALATDGLGVTNRGDLGQILPEWEGSSRDGYQEVDRILQVWENHFTLESNQKTLIALAYENNPVVLRHLNTGFKRANPVNIPRAVILYGTSVK